MLEKKFEIALSNNIKMEPIIRIEKYDSANEIILGSILNNLKKYIPAGIRSSNII